MQQILTTLLLSVPTGGVLHTADVRTGENVESVQIFDGKTLNGWKGEEAAAHDHNAARIEC